jgi:hypothetical protein
MAVKTEWASANGVLMDDVVSLGLITKRKIIQMALEMAAPAVGVSAESLCSDEAVDDEYFVESLLLAIVDHVKSKIDSAVAEAVERFRARMGPTLRADVMTRSDHDLLGQVIGVAGKMVEVRGLRLGAVCSVTICLTPSLR